MSPDNESQILLYQALVSAGIPVSGVTGVSPNVQIIFLPSATPQQIQQGNSILAGFDWTKGALVYAQQQKLIALMAWVQQQLTTGFVWNGASYALDLASQVKWLRLATAFTFGLITDNNGTLSSPRIVWSVNFVPFTITLTADLRAFIAAAATQGQLIESDASTFQQEIMAATTPAQVNGIIFPPTP